MTRHFVMIEKIVETQFAFKPKGLSSGAFQGRTY